MKVNLNNAIKKFLESISVDRYEIAADRVKYIVYTHDYYEMFTLEWEKEEPYVLEGSAHFDIVTIELIELIVTYLIKEKRKFFKEDIDKINVYYDGYESEYFEYEK